MRTHLAMLSSVALLRVCNSTSTTTDAAPPPPPPPGTETPVAPTAVPETVQAGPHGGVVASSGGVTSEVLAQPDGNLVAYFTNAQGQSIKPSSLTISLRKPDGTDQPVAVAYDDSIQGYKGLIADVPPSAYPVAEVAQFDGMIAPLEILTAPVTVSALAPAPTPRHHGHIERFGDKICETVVSRDGSVAMFWTDQNGEAIPPADVGMTEVGVWVGGRRVMVPVQYDGGYYRGHADFAPGTDFSVELTNVRVDGRPYFGGRWRHPVLVDQVQVEPRPEPYPVYGQPNYVPPEVIVSRPGWQAPPGWNPHPYVVVQRPGYAPPGYVRPSGFQQQPGVVVQRPGGFQQQPGVVVQRPGVFVQQPGVVMQHPGMQPPGAVGQPPVNERPGSVIGTVRPGFAPTPPVAAHELPGRTGPVVSPIPPRQPTLPVERPPTQFGHPAVVNPPQQPQQVHAPPAQFHAPEPQQQVHAPPAQFHAPEPQQQFHAPPAQFHAPQPQPVREPPQAAFHAPQPMPQPMRPQQPPPQAFHPPVAPPPPHPAPPGRPHHP